MAAKPKATAKAPTTRKRRKKASAPLKLAGPPPTKGDITITLSCAHSFKTNARPNPRKAWPDPIMCEVCRKKFRPVHIITRMEKKK